LHGFYTPAGDLTWTGYLEAGNPPFFSIIDRGGRWEIMRTIILSFTQVLLIIICFTIIISPVSGDLPGAHSVSLNGKIPVQFSAESGFYHTSFSGGSLASAPDPGGNRVDPFAIIDEKLAPAEAAGLKALIHNTLHAFSYDDATGAWTACNAANQITFTYTPDGTATFSQDQDTFGLTLIGIGRDGEISPAKTGVTSASGRQLNITRQEFTEWYRNNDESVE
jgi:hypothetical protein